MARAGLRAVAVAMRTGIFRRPLATKARVALELKDYMQMIGIELYASEAHKAGRLKLDERGGGYGFPLSYGVRDLYEGRDQLL